MNDSRSIFFCGLELPCQFDSYDQYEMIVETLVQLDGVTEVPPVRLPNEVYVGFRERWFKEVSSNKIARLVEPDAPFRGMCRIVDVNIDS